MKLTIAFVAGASAVVYHEHGPTNQLMQKLARHMPTLACDGTAQECADELKAAMMACATPLYSVMGDPDCSSLAAAMSGMSQPGTGEMNGALDALCLSACLPKLKGVLREYGECLDPLMAEVTEGSSAALSMDVGKIMSTAFDFMCLKNDASGEYCLAEVVEFGTMTAQIRQQSPPYDMCVTFSSMGCCMTSLLEYTQSMLPDTDMTSSFPCSLPPACMGTGQTATYKSAVFTLANTAFAGKDLEDRDLQAAIRTDVARMTGVPVEDISVSITEVGGSIKVTVTVRGDNDAETQTYDMSGVAGGELTNTQTELGSSSALTVEDAAVTEGTMTGQEPIVDTNSAAALLPAAAVVAALLL